MLAYDRIPEEEIAYKLLLFIVGGLILGVIGALVLAPALGDKIGDFFFTSPETVKPEPGSAARAKMAQGDYEGAVEEFLKLAEEDPSDRTPWVEVIRIRREKLEDSEGALESAQAALSAHEWSEDDEAFFLFRIAEIAKADLDDLETTVGALNTVVERFPETRSSANAQHMLREIEADS